MTISISGEWDYRFDSENVGLLENWQEHPIVSEGEVELPGTTDTRGIGPENTESSEFHLNRAFKYRGAIWFERIVNIPHSLDGLAVALELERVQWESRAWINGKSAGMQESLSTPHHYDLTGLLRTGPNRITIRVDNNIKYVIHHSHGTWEFTHAISDETQGNWNGIIGNMIISAKPMISLDTVQVFISEDAASATARIVIDNRTEEQAELKIEGHLANGIADSVTTRITAEPGSSIHHLEIALPENVERWDEFSPNLQNLNLSLYDGSGMLHEKAVTFGVYDLVADQRHFFLNGRRLFLRGNLECAIWPLTGHTPMEPDGGWNQLMAALKEHGMNHLRFHSWCPPKAAFLAADEAGVILQIELPLWDGFGDIGKDPARTVFLREEAYRILETYGNHPSFMLFSMGNELGHAEDQWLIDLVKKLKQHDPRRFYTSTTHPMFMASDDDFFVSANSPAGRIRGIMTPAGDRHGFNDNYSANMASVDRPVIAHEIGQYSMFFNPNEIEKYTGSMKARNLELMRDSMIRNNLIDMAEPFRVSSAHFQLSLYKREFEQMLVTPEMAGFQALGLQDFSGQGTTMCGFVDAFWEPKGILPSQAWRQFCAPTVPLARFNDAILKESDTFMASVKVAHYGPSDIKDGVVEWSITNEGQVLRSGSFSNVDIPTGELTKVGAIAIPLATIAQTPAQVELTVSIEDNHASNSWNLWIFPDHIEVRHPEETLVSNGWDDNCKEVLAAGGKVIIVPEARSLSNGVPTRWTPVFWNKLLFPNQESTIGIHLDPAHPVFSGFPTNCHSDLQWQQLLDGGVRGIDLSGTEIRPLIWLIDNFHSDFHRKLGAIFEARVGNGRLLVASLNLHSEEPEARQLLKSIYEYVSSDEFDPKQSISFEELDHLLLRGAHALGGVEDPDGLDTALLDVNANQHADSGLSPNDSNYDEIIRKQDGFSYEVSYQSGWKDEVGSAWVGNDITITVTPPSDFSGRMAVRLHDWNNTGRDAQLYFNGHDLSTIGPHTEGRWLIMEMDGSSLSYTLVANRLSGPNIMVTRLVVLE